MFTIKQANVYNFLNQPFLAIRNLLTQYIKPSIKHLQLTHVDKSITNLKIGDTFNALLQGNIHEQKYYIYKITKKDYIVISSLRTIYNDFGDYAIDSYLIHKINKYKLDKKVKQYINR